MKDKLENIKKILDMLIEKHLEEAIKKYGKDYVWDKIEKVPEPTARARLRKIYFKICKF